MPAGLESIYQRNWDDILKLPSNDRSRALGILRWATFATKPLTAAELTEALLIRDNDGFNVLQLDDLPDSIDDEYIAGEISGLCGSLLEVRSHATRNQSGTAKFCTTHFHGVLPLNITHTLYIQLSGLI